MESQPAPCCRRQLQGTTPGRDRQTVSPNPSSFDSPLTIFIRGIQNNLGEDLSTLPFICDNACTHAGSIRKDDFRPPRESYLQRQADPTCSPNVLGANKIPADDITSIGDSTLFSVSFDRCDDEKLPAVNTSVSVVCDDERGQLFLEESEKSWNGNNILQERSWNDSSGHWNDSACYSIQHGIMEDNKPKAEGKNDSPTCVSAPSLFPAMLTINDNLFRVG
jgi:hypothetical protein